MADLYALEFVGGPDKTLMPAKKLDGRLVSAKKRRTRAVKPSTILNIGDRLYIGKLPQGGVLQHIDAVTDTTFGTATLSIGTTAVPNKYANARTLTATDVPTVLGPRATAAVLQPAEADEELWLTVGVAAIAAATIAAIRWEYTIST